MIPLSKDVAELVGSWAEKVENRGLLHEKFALPKVWGHPTGDKFNDASRWNVLRIAEKGKSLLDGDASRLRREANGRNVREDVRDRKIQDATIADKMAKSGTFAPDVASLAAKKGKHFLEVMKQSRKEGVLTFEATLGARMMINMAGGVIENAGIALDRCLGLPFIPGSAVKGITRAQALWEIKEETDSSKKKEKLRFAMLIFGFGGQDIKRNGAFGWAGGESVAKEIASSIQAEDFKGTVCFLPAYPTSSPQIVVDMVNPHYREYYSGRRQRATDDEAPIPNYFPAVKEGTSFGFALMINRIPQGVTQEQLLEQSKTWLENALTEKGVGAKTAAGYGWFELGGRKENPQNSHSETNQSSKMATATLIADYNEAIFTNAVLKKLNPGQLETLRVEIAKLKKPENAEWCTKLCDKLKESSSKDIRKRLSTKEWFPKEWLP